MTATVIHFSAYLLKWLYRHHDVVVTTTRPLKVHVHYDEVVLNNATMIYKNRTHK